LSKTQTCETIGLDKKRLSELLELKEVQSLMPQGLRMSGKVQYEGGTKPIDPVCLDEAGDYILSKTQVVGTIGLDKKRLSQLLELKEVQSLMPQGPRLSGKVYYEGGTKPHPPCVLG